MIIFHNSRSCSKGKRGNASSHFLQTSINMWESLKVWNQRDSEIIMENRDSLRLHFSEMSPDEVQSWYCFQMSKNCKWHINNVSTLDQSLSATEWDANKASHCLSLWERVALEALHVAPACYNHRLPANVKKKLLWWSVMAPASFKEPAAMVWIPQSLIWACWTEVKIRSRALRIVCIEWKRYKMMTKASASRSAGCRALNIRSWFVGTEDKTEF